MNTTAVKVGQLIAYALMIGTLTGCATSVGTIGDQLNPYADANSGELGERSLGAISGGGTGGKNSELARHALEVIGTYPRAHAPQPVYPVIRPAEVRLMWIPDHQNLYADLIPAHYYYLRVTNDGWEVRDAFDIERQYGEGAGRIQYGSGGNLPGSATTTPWIYKESK